MLILLRFDDSNSYLLLDNIFSKLRVYQKQKKKIKESELDLIQVLEPFRLYERSLLISDDEVMDRPFNKFLLFLDSVFLKFDENCPYVKNTLSNNYAWGTSVVLLLLFSGIAPVYFRNFKLIPGGDSRIVRPINFVLMTQLVTFASYFSFVSLLNISGRSSYYDLITRLVEATRKRNSIKVLESLKVDENTLLYHHLTKHHKLFGPLLQYYNPNFVANFTMENNVEFALDLETVTASFADDVELHPVYSCLSLNANSLPILGQCLICFVPLPKSLKISAHLVILSSKTLKLAKQFFKRQEDKKIKEVRENLIKRFK
jgi:hypothetical protein